VIKSTVRYSCFPRTEPPPDFVGDIVEIFRRHEDQLSTLNLSQGKKSDEVLAVLQPGLLVLGFEVEKSKSGADKILRPVFYGENGTATLTYQVDAFHPEWKCGLEVEAGRAWMGNAVYRDLIQAMVMVRVDHLCLAVPNIYKYQSGGRPASSNDYANTVAVADALYGHMRVRIPYGLTIVGY
jgi:hypothetical protein